MATFGDTRDRPNSYGVCGCACVAVCIVGYACGRVGCEWIAGAVKGEGDAEFFLFSIHTPNQP